MGQINEGLACGDIIVMDTEFLSDQNNTGNGSDISIIGQVCTNPNLFLSQRSNKFFNRKADDLPDIPCVVTEIKVWQASEDMRSVGRSVQMAACGCSVCPDNNNIISAVCTFRHQLPNHRDNTFAVPSAGFVSVWAFDYEDTSDDSSSEDSSSDSSLNSMDSYIYPETHCFARNFTYSPLPSCKFSPNSQILTSILNSGKGMLSVLGRQKGEELASYDVCRLRCDGLGGQNSLCGRTVCSFFSRLGDRMATVSNVTLYSNRNIDVHELCMWSTKSNSHFLNKWQLGLDAACPGFRGYICTGKFSPDGQYVGLSSTRGHLMLVETETGILATDIPGFLEDTTGGSCMFDFDPRFHHSILSVGYWTGMVNILRLGKSTVHKLFEFNLLEGIKLCSLSYSFDGQQLALGSSNGIITLLTTDDGRVSSVLDFMSNLPVVVHRDTSVMDIQFTTSCQEIVSAYSDGIVRIWQLPRILDLQHICRLKIRSLVPAKEISDLPLSWTLISDEGINKDVDFWMPLKEYLSRMIWLNYSSEPHQIKSAFFEAKRRSNEGCLWKKQYKPTMDKDNENVCTI